MKNTRWALAALVVATVVFFSFTVLQKTCAIKGTVTPADKAVRVWAISPTDTLNTKLQDGAFEFKDVKSGTYSIIIEAEDPYPNTRRKDVVVETDNPVTDVGEIKLQPKN